MAEVDVPSTSDTTATAGGAGAAASTGVSVSNVEFNYLDCLESGQFTDFTLIVGEKRYKTHKYACGAHSLVLAVVLCWRNGRMASVADGGGCVVRWGWGAG